ncbi:MAG: phage portal protein [Xylophilus ampelinus]
MPDTTETTAETAVVLPAAPQGSRVLGEWLATRPGGAERAGVLALAENGSESGLTVNELANLLGAATRSSSGVAVTRDTAMRVSTVYACVSLIAGAIGSLPLGIFERSGSDRQKADHDYWYLFNERACDGWTAFAAWEYLISAKLFYGDGFARLLRSSFRSSQIIGWEPLHPLTVQPFRKDGRLLYRVSPNDGSPAYTLDSADMLHLPSLGFDGLRSPSPITYAARDAIGTAIASQDFAGRFFTGSANFDYALKAPGRLADKQLLELKASLIARAQNGGRGPLILSGGLEPAQLSVNSKDAEILATRLFGVEEICSALGVPPHMAGHTSKASSFGTGIEEMSIGFVRYTLQRHLTPLAQEINAKLWPIRQRFFVEHISAALERANLKTRFEAFRIALGRAGEAPWMSVDEVRRMENMGPAPDLTMNGGADAQPTSAAPE